jgi:hypothetical protein
MNQNTNSTGITIRRLGPSDEAAIERLVELDSGTRPEEPLLGAEVEGRLLVAMSVASGKSVADPFSRTQELRDIVGIRVAQLGGRDKRSRRGRRVRTRSRGTVGASPPGGGGRLLTLPVRLG